MPPLGSRFALVSTPMTMPQESAAQGSLTERGPPRSRPSLLGGKAGVTRTATGRSFRGRRLHESQASFFVDRVPAQLSDEVTATFAAVQVRRGRVAGRAFPKQPPLGWACDAWDAGLPHVVCVAEPRALLQLNSVSSCTVVVTSRTPRR
jgi:hypothetical protein